MGEKKKSYTLINHGWFTSPQNPLTTSERFLYYMLRSHNNANLNCYPSLSTLSRETGISISSVEKLIPSLERKGVIRIERVKGKNNSRKNNHYYFREDEVDDPIKDPYPGTIKNAPEVGASDAYGIIKLDNSSLISNNNIKTNTGFSQVQSAFDVDYLKQKCNPELVDACLQIIANVLESGPSRRTFYIDGELIGKNKVIERFNHITTNEILHVCLEYEKKKETINRRENYIRSMLYKADLDLKLYAANQMSINNND